MNSNNLYSCIADNEFIQNSFCQICKKKFENNELIIASDEEYESPLDGTTGYMTLFYHINCIRNNYKILSEEILKNSTNLTKSHKILIKKFFK